jgi:hypothetical protein
MKARNNDYSGRVIFRKDDPKSNRTYGENTFSLLPKDLSGWTSLRGIYISQHTMLNEEELFKSLFTIGAKKLFCGSLKCQYPCFANKRLDKF